MSDIGATPSGHGVELAAGIVFVNVHGSIMGT